MPTEHIIALLRAERDRLNAALQALEGTAKRRGRPRKIADDSNMPDWVKPSAKKAPKRKGRKFSAAQRKAASERMAARWAAKKATPKPKRKAKVAAAGE